MVPHSKVVAPLIQIFTALGIPVSQTMRRLVLQPEWQPLLNDLDRLQEATIEKDGKVITCLLYTSPSPRD